MGYDVRELGPDHNDALLTLAREAARAPDDPDGGPRTSVRTDRAPDYFRFLEAAGGEPTVLGAFDGPRLVGTVSLVRRPVTWNGGAVEAHSMCDLKVAPDHRRSRALARILRAVHARVVPGLCFGGVAPRNDASLAITGGLAGFREYVEIGRQHHLASFTGRAPRSRGNPGFEIGEPDDADWTAAYDRLAPQRNLVAVRPPPRLPGERRLVARRRGRVAAIARLVDAAPMRAMRLDSLSRRDALRHAALNLLAPIARWPRIPGPGRAVPIAFVADLLHEPDETDGAAALLAHAHRTARADGLPVLAVDVAEDDPFAGRAGSILSARRFAVSCVVAAAAPGRADRPCRLNLHEL